MKFLNGKVVLGLATVFAVCNVGTAAVILADYNFDSNSLASADTDIQTTATDLGSGGGVPIDTFDGSDGLLAPSLKLTMGHVNDGTFLDDDYYTFTIEADGSTIDFTALDLNFKKQSGGASVELRVYSSIGGFTAGNELGTASFSSFDWESMNVDLSGLTGVTADTEFRVYLQTGGTFGPNQLNLDNITVQGDIAAVPEPASLAAGLMGLTFFAARRRR